MTRRDEQWGEVWDADHAFPSDWRKQCDIAEAIAIEDEPLYLHAYYRERARFILWLGVYERGKVPKSWTFKITAKRTLTCDIDTCNLGALVTNDEGVEVSALDVYAVIRCRDLRRLLGKPRR